MSKSPFELKQFKSTYATIFVDTPDSSSLAFDELGNAILSAEKIPFKVYLKQSGTEVRQVSLAGSNTFQIKVCGYLINPMKLPHGINPPLQVEAVINGRRGVLQIEPSIPKPFGSESYTGQFIQGWFGATE